MTERVPPSTVTPWANPLTVREPPSMVRDPVEQRQRSRSPPITLPVPVNRNEAASSSSMEPGPLMTPEKVVLVLPEMNRMVLGSDAPSRKAPAPASEPISTEPPFPIASVAPLLTLKFDVEDELLLIVKVAPF